MISRKLLIKGKVQGVFYRVSAKETAEKLGIKGWVRNTEEGNVEIHCQGSEKGIEEFTNWCRKGPARAKVESVDVTETNEEVLDEFTIIRGT